MSLRRSAVVLGVLGLCAGITATATAADSGTLAFVIRDWYIAMHEGKFMDECPEGLTVGNDEIWWRNESKEVRAQVTGNGLTKSTIRYYEAMDRGRNGENVCLNPTSISRHQARVSAWMGLPRPCAKCLILAADSVQSARRTPGQVG